MFCGSSFQYLSVFWINRVFKCSKLAVHFKLILSMTFAVLYKYLNCALDKTIDTCHATSADCDTNYRIILLCYLLLPGGASL